MNIITEVFYFPAVGSPGSGLVKNHMTALDYNYFTGNGTHEGSGPQHFWHRGVVSWKTIFHRPGVGRRLQDDSGSLHALVTLFLLLLHQLQLRSAGIRSRRLGTPTPGNYSSHGFTPNSTGTCGVLQESLEKQRMLVPEL